MSKTTDLFSELLRPIGKAGGYVSLTFVLELFLGGLLYAGVLSVPAFQACFLGTWAALLASGAVSAFRDRPPAPPK